MRQVQEARTEPVNAFETDDDAYASLLFTEKKIRAQGYKSYWVDDDTTFVYIEPLGSIMGNQRVILWIAERNLIQKEKEAKQ